MIDLGLSMRKTKDQGYWTQVESHQGRDMREERRKQGGVRDCVRDVTIWYRCERHTDSPCF